MAVYDFVLETGVIVPDTSTLLADVTAEFRQIFGDDLVTTPDTPQGALITMFSLERAAVAANNAQVANQINPDIAGGVFLDALYALLGGKRIPAQSSTVLTVVTGVAGTIIPITAIAALNTGQQFSPVEAITIQSNGSATGYFYALETGPTAVPIGSLTTIFAGEPGWETINNTIAGTPGNIVASDQITRYLRSVTLAQQGSAGGEAIESGLFAANIGVGSLTFQENVKPGIIVDRGITMLGHSMYACVASINGPENYTTVIVNLIGTPGTIVPVTVIAQDGTGNQYSPIAPITLDSFGFGIGIFQALVVGAESTPPYTLVNKIGPNWTGVTDIINPSSNSVYSQEFLQDVASVIKTKKSVGSNYSPGPGIAPYGPQTILVYSPVAQRNVPVTFDIPTPIPILAQVYVTVTPTFVGDPVSAVQNAILAYAAGELAGEAGFIVGADVSPWELASAVINQNPGLIVTKTLIAVVSNDPAFSTDIIPIEIFQQATIEPSAIAVFVTYNPTVARR